MILNIDKLQPRSASCLDGDSCLAAAEVLRDQVNQFRVGLAIHRRRLELRDPLTRLILTQLACPSIRFHLQFDDQRLLRHGNGCTPKLGYKPSEACNVRRRVSRLLAVLTGKLSRRGNGNDDSK